MKMETFKLTSLIIFLAIMILSVIGCEEPGIDPTVPAPIPTEPAPIPTEPATEPDSSIRGHLDTSLGEGGSLGFDTNYTDVYDILVDKDGIIKLTGEFSESSMSRRIYIWSFNEDGSSNMNQSTTDHNVFLNSYAITETDSGEIRTCGTKAYDMQRFEANMHYMQSFAAYNEKSAGYGITAKDGRTLIAGKVGSQFDGIPLSMQIWCYDSAFSTDTNFGTNGIANFANNAAYQTSEGWDIEIDKDGKIFVAGNCTADSKRNIALWKYNSDGTIDSSFGDNGIVLENLGGTASTAAGKAVEISADGRIFVTGYLDSNMVLLCYNSDGSLDTSFAENGRAVSSHAGYKTKGFDIAITSDGDIIVSGLREKSATDAFLKIWCYNSDGTLDTDFDEDGIIDGSGITSKNADFWSIPVALDKKGRIIISASCVHPDNPDGTMPYFWRYLN